MGSKSKAPPPDPRMGEAAHRQILLNERMFEDYQANDRPWMQSIANEALGITRGNAERANALSDYQLENMRRNDSRYWAVGVPFEDQLLQDVDRFDTQAYRDGLVRASKADVGMAFDRMGHQNSRAAGRMGITRAIRATNDVAMEKAKAEAAAAYKTEQAARQVGLSSKMQMYGGMRGLAGLGATNAQLAVGGIGAGNQSGQGMMGAAGGYLSANSNALGSANSGISAGINGLGQYSQLGIQAANVNAQNDPFSTILGAAAGVGTARLLSDRRLKKDIQKLGEMSDGLGVYQYEYVWGGGTRIGVMADEVLKLRPHAYAQMGDYGAVDYAAL
jgi:hypothetical protein